MDIEIRNGRGEIFLSQREYIYDLLTETDMLQSKVS